MPRPQLSLQPRLLRAKQAAGYLGIGVKALRKLVLIGILTPVQMRAGGNSPFLFDIRDLDRFIEGLKD